MILLCERLLAKEDKSRRALRWKSPRLSYYRADKGLQYGLSGDRVAFLATERLALSRETASAGDGEQCKGKTYPTYAVSLILSAAIILFLIGRIP